MALSQQASIERIRHSLAHVLAQAVQELWPGTKLGFGPPIEDGFYYDFVLQQPLSEADFPRIEARMREILGSGQQFVREELAPDQALLRLQELGEPYKAQYAEELFARGAASLRFYRSGPFVDMCDGPHVASTQEIPADAFELRSVAGAYFRGDVKNVQMTRIYAWAFAARGELEVARERYAQALLRDHKKLGKELEIFSFDAEIGKGLPLWLPNGTVIRDELEKWMRELEFEAEYKRVVTPQLAQTSLYYRTGHLPYFAEHMFPFMHAKAAEPAPIAENAGAAPAHTEGESPAYCLRPMNCPHHHKIFAARRRSYRELPLRLAEYGQVYRYEDAGAVSGLLRVRGMSMNDAHIYCMPEQVERECLSVLAMHRHVYQVLGLQNFELRLSVQDPAKHGKYVENQAAWAESEDLLRKVLLKAGLPFKEVPGEAAFYGPKIDFQFRSVLGREETASTLQLDFTMPERMDLCYVGPDGREARPLIIHRAPLGTHERFVALLLEHYAGAFPTWLAPVQVRVLPIQSSVQDYADQVVSYLRKRFIRAECDGRAESLNRKIRQAHAAKIPHLVVVGEREKAAGEVSVRRFAAPAGAARVLALPAFAAELAQLVSDRQCDSPSVQSGAAGQAQAVS